MLLCRGQAGFEDVLAGELRARGLTETERGGGWLTTTDGRPEVIEDLCFAHTVATAAVEVGGDSVNALATRLLDQFLDGARDERFEGAWPCVFSAAAGLDGLGRRMDAVEQAFRELLKKRMGRVARLATDELPRGVGRARGFFVQFVDFKRAYVSREVVLGGQRRMSDDPAAPSRSYLKIEEAYGLLGREPAAGEVVVDLGAAPGGWSYSAAKRGARVIALDNGPLKGGALGHTLIEHRREDAYAYRPAAGERVDWLFCDLVDDPREVMRRIVEPWLINGWCRRFVVILKFGRVDPLALLREVRAGDGVLARRASGTRVRHLFHDREEFTLTGEVT